MKGMFESLCNLLRFFYWFQVLPLEYGCLTVVCDLVIIDPLNGFICSCNIIINFGIRLKVSNVSYHGCYGNLLSIVLVSN